MLVIWAYNLDDIIPTCRDFEDKLIKLVWNMRAATLGSLASSAAPSTTGSEQNLTEKATQIISEKEVAVTKEKEHSNKREKGKSRSCRLGLGYFVSNKEDVEKTAAGPSYRPMRLFAPFYGGLAAALAICKRLRLCVSVYCISSIVIVFVGSGVSVLIVESVQDGDYTRFALLVTAPFLFCVSLVSVFCWQ